MNQPVDIMEMIMRLWRAIKRNTHCDSKLPRGSFRLLRVLLAEDGIRASDLAERLDIRPSSLTEILKRLEQSGDISRKQDESDSRVFRLYVTDKARGEFAEHWNKRQKQSEALGSCLSAEELAAFQKICSKLIDFLESDDTCQDNLDIADGD